MQRAKVPRGGSIRTDADHVIGDEDEENFDDIDVRSNLDAFIVEDLRETRGEEDNFEENIYGADMGNFDLDKITNELLFSVQGLGAVKKIGEHKVYVINEHCEESLKSLCKFCKRDDPNNPIVRIQLAKWNVAEKDLIPLLITQFQDKKISFYNCLLLVMLTEVPEESKSNTGSLLVGILQDYKLQFLNKDVMLTLMNHLEECVKVPEDKRVKAHDQMVELIFTLIRNLTAIPDSQTKHPETVGTNDLRCTLQFNFLQTLATSFFDIILFLSEDFSSPLMKKLNILFLEIYFNILSPFSPKWITAPPDEDDKYLQEMIERDKYENLKRKSELSTRHSRFDSKIVVKRKFDGSHKIISNPAKIAEINTTHSQLKKPKARGVVAKFSSLWKKSLVNDTMRVDDGLVEDDNFKSAIRNFAMEFMSIAFSPLIESLYEEIYKGSDRVQVSDKIAYLVILAFGLSVLRNQHLSLKEMSSKKENGPSFPLDIGPVVPALQLTQFELIYSIMIGEVTKTKKKDFSYQLFFTAIAAFYEQISLVKEMSMSASTENRKNAQILMQNIFHHDITRILRMGYLYCIPGVLNDQMLKVLTELTMVFFDLLEAFSKGKVLSIQTDRRIKVKKKNKSKIKSRKDQQAEELKDFIENDGLDENDDAEYEPGKQKSKKKSGQENENEAEDKANQEDDLQYSGESETDEEDDFVYRERKFNFVSEVAILAEYTVLAKILSLMEDDKLLENENNLNIAIFKYMKRICELLKAEWLFFQTDFLKIFEAIISNQEIRVTFNMKTDLRNIVDLIRKILRSFFILLKKNKLLIVESLFRFPDKEVKDSILCNYDDLLPGNDGNQPAENYYEAENEPVLPSKEWTESEDRILIANYDDFKSSPSFEDQLLLVLEDSGSYNKTALDVKRRIKVLRLHKGKQRARKIFEEIHRKKETVVELFDVVQDTLGTLKDANFTKEELERFFDKLMQDYLQFKAQMPSEDPSDNHHDIIQVKIMNSIDFAVVPVEMKDFEILEWPSVERLFLALEFRRPMQGECYWRIPGYLTVSEVNEKNILLAEAFQGLRREKNEALNKEGDIVEEERVEMPEEKEAKEGKRERLKKKSKPERKESPTISAPDKSNEMEIQKESTRVQPTTLEEKRKDSNKTKEQTKDPIPAKKFNKNNFASKEIISHVVEDDDAGSNDGNDMGTEGKNHKQHDEMVDEQAGFFKPKNKQKKLKKIRDTESLVVEPTIELDTQATQYLPTLDVNEEQEQLYKLNRHNNRDSGSKSKKASLEVEGTLVLEDADESFL